MASWSKLKQKLESFLAESLVGRVEYRASSYRYVHDRPGRCYITVDKKEVFSMCDLKHQIRWYQTKQDIIKDDTMVIKVTEDEKQELMKEFGGTIPEERLPIIIKQRKLSEMANELLEAQGILAKADFFDAATKYLSSSVDASLASKEILLNIFAIIDRRVGKARLKKLKDHMEQKHPIVQYFYKMRCEADGIY